MENIHLLIFNYYFLNIIFKINFRSTDNCSGNSIRPPIGRRIFTLNNLWESDYADDGNVDDDDDDDDEEEDDDDEEDDDGDEEEEEEDYDGDQEEEE